MASPAPNYPQYPAVPSAPPAANPNPSSNPNAPIIFGTPNSIGYGPPPTQPGSIGPNGVLGAINGQSAQNYARQEAVNGSMGLPAPSQNLSPAQMQNYLIWGQHANDPSNYGYYADTANAANLTQGAGNSTPDVSMYQLGGSPYFAGQAATQQLSQANQFLNRQAIQGNYGAADQAGQAATSAAGQLGALGSQNLAQPGASGQMATAQQLQALGSAQQGPSAAELSMRQAAGQSEQQQAALAAGARGGNAALALRTAANNQGQTTTNLTQQLGVQRAQEDLAYRQQQAAALGAAGQAYGASANTLVGGQQAQAGALAQSGSLGLGSQGQFANEAGQNAALAAQQQQANTSAAMQSQGLGYGVLSQQLSGNEAFDASRTGNYQQEYATQLGYANAANAAAQANANREMQYIAAGAQLAGSLFTASDVRAKTDIEGAAPELDDAYRSLGSYGYAYRDPGRFGYGTHYGPMAQELEQSPAGASTVQPAPDGTKTVDTGKLTMMNASQIANLTKRLDQVSGQADQVRDTRVSYPSVGGGALTPDGQAAAALAQKNNATAAQLAAAKQQMNPLDVEGNAMARYGLARPATAAVPTGAPIPKFGAAPTATPQSLQSNSTYTFAPSAYGY